MINFINKTDEDISSYIKIIKKYLKNHVKKNIISIVFVTEEEIKRLNNNYRNIDQVTDVLSFPIEDEDELGDIFICLKKAYFQASEYEHSINREILFLATHGFLHLKGYDHESAEEEEKMIVKQKEIMRKFLMKERK